MSKKRRAVLISCIAAAALIGGLFLYRYVREKSSSKDGGQTVYVQTVDDIMGTGSGLTNKFAGVVDTQETWSVPQSSDSTVKQILVSVGQTVTKGTPLLIYDTDKYQSDLQQANIDLQRIQNEISSLQSTITQLTNEKKKAAAYGRRVPHRRRPSRRITRFRSSRSSSISSRSSSTCSQSSLTSRS